MLHCIIPSPFPTCRVNSARGPSAVFFRIAHMCTPTTSPHGPFPPSMRDVAMTDAEGDVPIEAPVDGKITIVSESVVSV